MDGLRAARRRSAAMAASIDRGALLLQRGRLSLELELRPFSFTLRRDGRRLLRNGGL